MKNDFHFFFSFQYSKRGLVQKFQHATCAHRTYCFSANQMKDKLEKILLNKRFSTKIVYRKNNFISQFVFDELYSIKMKYKLFDLCLDEIF